MSMTAAAIVTLANQISKTPGYVTQAGQILNAVLQEVADTYDFDCEQEFYSFNFNTSLIAPSPQNTLVTAGSGPYPMPAGFLRANYGDVFWVLPGTGVAYPMTAIDIAEFDQTVQQAGMASYPYWYTIDMSTNPPGMYVYPQPSGNYPVFVRYFGRQTDLSVPAPTSVPWFDHSTYLYTRLAGEMCKLSGDMRWKELLGVGPEGAQGIMNRLLKMVDNKGTRAQSVKLDRRRFGPRYSQLPNTKTVGW